MNDDIAFSSSQRLRSDWTESERVAALARFNIIENKPDEAFDDLTKLAADICRARVSAVSLVDSDRIWIKSEVGLGIRETPLSESVCNHAVRQTDPVFVVPDLAQDPRLADLPLVKNEPKLRFYAGALLIDEDGLPLGTLCVLDPAPRPDGLDASQMRALKMLARQTVKLMTLGRALADQKAIEQELRSANTQAIEAATEQVAILNQLAEGVIVTDAEGRIVFVNDAAARIHGVSALNVAPKDYSDTYHLFTEDGRPYPPEELPLARAVLRGETSVGARWRIRRPDGSNVLAIGNAGPVVSLGGKRLGSVLTLSDDTARIVAERSVQESETQLRALADNLEKGWVYRLTMTPDGRRRRFAYASQGCARLLGVSAGEIMTDASIPLQLVLSEYQSGFEQAERAALRNMTQLDIEVPIRRADTGEERWTRIVASPRLLDDDLVVWDGLQIDTTDLMRRTEEFRALADNIPTLCWMARSDGHIFWYNRRWYEFTGLSFEEQEGWGWESVHDPDLLPAVKERWIRSLETGEPFEMTFPLRRADGVFRMFLTRIVPIHDASGTVARWFGTNADVTDEIEAREALRQSEAKFRAIAESMPQMVWSTRPDGFHDYYNPQWYAFTGVPEGSTDSEAWYDMFHPEEQQRVWALWRHSLESGDNFEVECRLRHRSGALRWVLCRAHPVRDAEGRIARWMGACTDIDDIVEARKLHGELREELARQVADRTRERDRIWDLSEDLLVTADFKGRLLAVNPSWTVVLGFDRVTLLEMPYADLVHPDDLGAVLSQLDELRVTGRPVRFENRVATADGDWRTVAWRLSLDPSGLVLHGVGRDMTEMRAQEKALRETEGALRHAQKMEAVGQLTGGIAHDFNNLLTVVVGNLEMLNRQLPDDADRMRRTTDSALKGANRAATLTQRLLAFSRRQPLAPKSIDLNKLIGGMSELMHRSLGETITIETVLASDLWRIEVDPSQLENALLNLAVNARDAMPEGGKLTIETTNSQLDEAYATTHAEVMPGQYVLICVSDTGTGIERNIIDRVFEPFFTTKDVGQGTGLGLSQVYGFVKQSGGHVKIHSERSDGTTVKLYFPRHAGDKDEPDIEHPHRVLDGSREETILVVEDHEDVRALSVEILRELGYKVIEAHDGPTALRLLARTPGIDLLFTDVILPGGMTGRDLAEQASLLRPDLKVLFTTGYARNAIVHQGRLEQGVELIGKPYTYAALATRIRDILDGEE